MSDAPAPIRVFCSYARQDERWLRKLETHLSLLKREGLITTWHRRLLLAGANWQQDVDAQLDGASLILLLISADFLSSDYCYGVEMQRALERERRNEVRVIPILVRPVDWHKAPFAHLRVLPTDAKPIMLWSNQDEACTNVVEGIRAVLEDIQPRVFDTRPAALPRLWNIPYRPNPFFTGQEALLAQLTETLSTGQPAALSQPQAIMGLGGIGKTQIAVHYAYQHAHDYQAILWVRADTHEMLISSYVALAQLLKLPEKDERDQTLVVRAVEQWLTTHQQEWLLIFDNADDLCMVSGYLRILLGGHILLTTRAHAVGSLAQRVEVETMSQEMGALFLLRRAGLLGLDASLATISISEQAIAYRITQELGGLPLALDQAGAYLEETGCSLASYQQMYQQHRLELLGRRGSFADHYPASVATTWTISFAKVKQHPAAADLLRCCALLHPDAIPEELFTNGAIHLGSRLERVVRDPLVFNESVRILLAYSLIGRDPTTTMLSIHRLVQTVLIDTLSKKQRSQWKERLVRAVNEAFPEEVFEEWTRCGRLLPHMLVCVTWIEHEPIPIPEACHVLHKAGTYLRERAQYPDAERILMRALLIRERHLGTEHPDTAVSLNSLAILCRMQGKYGEAESLYLRALSIREQCLGTEHRDTARSLHNLATLYLGQRKYEQAEGLYHRAISIYEQHFGSVHPDIARSLNGLGTIYEQQGKYEEAETLHLRALTIKEQYLGASHPYTAMSLHGLAELFQKQGNDEEAERFYRRALLIWEQCLGTEHPRMADELHGLAEISQEQGKDEQAEALYRRALTLREQRLGLAHPKTQEIRTAYVAFLRRVGRDAEAAVLEVGQDRDAAPSA